MESANLPKVLREQLMKILIQKESRYLRLRRQKMNKDMFEIVKHIGFGAFGVVSLVRKVSVSLTKYPFFSLFLILIYLL